MQRTSIWLACNKNERHLQYNMFYDFAVPWSPLALSNKTPNIVALLASFLFSTAVHSFYFLKVCLIAGMSNERIPCQTTCILFRILANQIRKFIQFSYAAQARVASVCTAFADVFLSNQLKTFQ